MSIRKFFTKRRLIWTAVIVVIVAAVGSLIYRSTNKPKGITTEVVKAQSLTATVLATGQVTSNTDLNLSFKSSGLVRRLNAKVGDKVEAGTLLAALDQKDQLAALTSARGSLTAAQANYEKILSGASNEQVAVAQRAVDAAQVNLDTTEIQQDVLVTNAHRALLNTGLAVEPYGIETGTPPTLSSAYTGTEEGFYKIRVIRDVNKGWGFRAFGLEETGDVFFDENKATPLGTKGLLLTFPGGQVDGDAWLVNIPNKKAAGYVTNYNAYQSALNTRDTAIAAALASLDSAIAQLNLEKAQARPADIQAAYAQILSAQGQVQSAQAALESTEIRTPAAGTVTKVEVKVGELANATTPVIVLEDAGNLYLEADVSEANIAEIKLGQNVDVTFDALGPDRKYTATVASVDPSSTVVAGVVNYKVKALLEKIEDIKPGMTANMAVRTGEKAEVLAVPTRAVISKDGKKYVRLITDPKKKTYTEVEVTTGFSGDGGLVEITSGLSAGQEIVTFLESK